MDDRTKQALERVAAYIKAKEVIASVNDYIDGAFYIESAGKGVGGSLALSDLRLLIAELRTRGATP